MIRNTLLATACLVLCVPACAQEADFDVTADITARGAQTNTLANAIWAKAELGYIETETTALLQQTLEDEGFTIQAGVADIPTAFVARFRQGARGGPVIGILAEMDALPGFSQGPVPEKQAMEGMTSGHACGHHLFGAGSVSAAIAVKRWLEATGTPGEIRLYGTPAEEGGSGKVYMVRAGLFDDLDVALHWHPGDANSADIPTNNANRSAKFRFSGISTHAASAPEKGRSALDGVEAMNMMVNMLREHTPDRTRIHYVITAGGLAPNVVPDFAEVYYYVRHPDPDYLRELWPRIEAAAEGAATGTGTEVEREIIHGNLSLLPNRALQEVLHEEMSKLGGVEYSADERAFALSLQKTLPDDGDPLEQAVEIQPQREFFTAGSTDVGDVSWTAPTGGVRTATWVPGTSAHSWQAVAAGGTSIGEKGMDLAAKTLANTAVRLYSEPALLDAARTEFNERRGPGYEYEPLLGDREPPLDYRQ
ncbi:amidohydrolase [Parvularcula sp. IMCC14364]|uniref:amidohydrolase n=1 Tax=Parvularcula sp. IMCC14364 TaxID=3067902 RepID=UPI0027418B52|nr:amidohydrolase [Parvularcula sp. IMCC14364]